MKYLLAAIFVSCIACEGVKEKKGPSAATCSEEQAIANVRNIPEVIRQAHYLDSLTHHQKGISFITDTTNIDGNAYYEIHVGFNSEFHRENYFTFYVNTQDCKDILVDEPVEGSRLPLSVWQQRAQKVVPLETQPVKLPFDFDEYYKACVYPEDKSKCAANYPSYPIENDASLKSIVEEAIDEDATDYFILPDIEAIHPYIIAYTQTDVERYYLVTVVNYKIIAKLQIGQVDDERLLYFVIDKDHVVHLYSRKQKNEAGTPQQQYQVKPDGTIVAIKN
ncbi:hypothetical protein [Chitinophaga sp.]|uniref:hypothetical protein n=1 Tax=Chitinophaga sp. TaxID=1869181 RepID=UPI0031CDF717